MARSAPQGRRARPSLKDLLRTRPKTAIDGLAMLAIGLGAGLFFGFYPQARQETLEALGYGLIPTVLWVAAALITLRYQHRSLAKYWRRWVSAATLVVITLGVMSYFHPGYGIVGETSLSGRWGAVVGGTPLAVMVLRLAAICLFVPLLLYPRRVGSTYLVALQKFGMGLHYAVTYAYLGGYNVTSFVGRRVRLIFNDQYLRRWINRVRRSLFRTSQSQPQVVESPGYAGNGSAGSIDTPVPWPDEELDTIPEWVTDLETPAERPAPLAAPVRVPGSKWPLPAIDCLSPPVPREQSQESLDQMARLVESTLAEHGVVVKVEDIKAGPRIVRFGLVPGWVTRRGEAAKDDGEEGKVDASRVKVQSILTREKDLALALKTPYLRIEAPVPGEALVGLEVPTPSPTKVHLRQVMESQAFQKISGKGGLPVALGEDTGGNPVVLDLAELPHLLIAGSTGSGKSVCINSIVASLLLTKPPDQFRVLMVDPKRVELTPFNEIPHLVAPVIVDVEDVNAALRGLMGEMFRRYKQMEETGTRNIAGYNAKAKEPMPFLVLIVDELADLMISGGYEVEQSLVRLAQLGRATGIHLVLATQRPSVNVVTGLLKANIPARIAFAVASQVDSRVILDMVGAEKLLGKGDMLLLSPDAAKPRRVQGTLVYDDEVDQLVKFWSNQKGPPLPVILIEDDGEQDMSDEELDERMMEQARELALRNPRLSASFLERRFKIGERRATQIMEHLEEEGLVIPR